MAQDIIDGINPTRIIGQNLLLKGMVCLKRKGTL